MSMLVHILEDALVETYLALKQYTFETTLITVVSVMAYRLTMHYLPKVAKTLRSRNIYGIDINKTTADERAVFVEQRRRGCTEDKEFEKRAIPESTGIIAGAVYLSSLVIIILLLNVDISRMSGPLITVTVMLLLGFVDDVLDIAWRHKLLLSALGSFPLILVYDGSQSMLIPPLLTRKLMPLLTVLTKMTSDTSNMIINNLSSFASIFTSSSPTVPTVHAVNTTLSNSLNETVNYIVGNSSNLLHTLTHTNNNNNKNNNNRDGVNSFSLMWLVQHTIMYVINHCGWLSEMISLTPRADYLLLSLGPLYLVYLSLLCIFCTNSINILAGVNGLEVGQSLVIAVASVLYNLLELRVSTKSMTLSSSLASMTREQGSHGNATHQLPLTSSTHLLVNNNNINISHNSTAGDVLNTMPSTTWASIHEISNDGISASHQLRALMLLGPFIGVSLALWQFNKYPARVFVGDSYTYFAGTVLAVAGITGVYSKTLLLFFLPQLINFVISLPQLFGIVACPRHRVPQWDHNADVLCNSHNYTILNAILYVTGPLHERTLTRVVLFIQVITCLFGFVLREWITSLMYEERKAVVGNK